MRISLQDLNCCALRLCVCICTRSGEFCVQHICTPPREVVTQHPFSLSKGAKFDLITHDGLTCGSWLMGSLKCVCVCMHVDKEFFESLQCASMLLLLLPQAICTPRSPPRLAAPNHKLRRYNDYSSTDGGLRPRFTYLGCACCFEDSCC